MPGDEFKACFLQMERASAVSWKSLEANFFPFHFRIHQICICKLQWPSVGRNKPGTAPLQVQLLTKGRFRSVTWERPGETSLDMAGLSFLWECLILPKVSKWAFSPEHAEGRFTLVLMIARMLCSPPAIFRSPNGPSDPWSALPCRLGSQNVQRNGLPKTMGWRSQGLASKIMNAWKIHRDTVFPWTHNGSGIIQTLSLYSNLLTTWCRRCYIPGRYFIVGSWNVTSSNMRDQGSSEHVFIPASTKWGLLFDCSTYVVTSAILRYLKSLDARKVHSLRIGSLKRWISMMKQLVAFRSRLGSSNFLQKC